jgi:hypothetical protein
MAEPRTRPTNDSVAAFLRKATDDETHADCLTLVKLMKQATGAAPQMWGPSIVGFGTRRLVYASGREVDWPLLGFSPRKKELTLYGLGAGRRETLVAKLGRCRMGKGCLYIKRLADVDLKVLQALIAVSVKDAKSKQG